MKIHNPERIYPLTEAEKIKCEKVTETLLNVRNLISDSLTNQKNYEDAVNDYLKNTGYEFLIKAIKGSNSTVRHTLLCENEYLRTLELYLISSPKTGGELLELYLQAIFLEKKYLGECYSEQGVEFLSEELYALFRNDL